MLRIVVQRASESAAVTFTFVVRSMASGMGRAASGHILIPAIQYDGQ